MDTPELPDQGEAADRPKPALGSVLEEFRPGSENIIAGMVLSLLFVAGGLVGIGWTIRTAVADGGKDNNLWASLGVQAIVFTGFAVGGVFAFRYASGLRSFRVAVCEDGLRVTSRGSTEDVPWRHIHHIEMIVSEDYFPLKGIAKHALPMGKSRAYRIHRRDGWEQVINKDRVRRIGRFGQLLEQYAEQHGVERRIIQMEG